MDFGGLAEAKTQVFQNMVMLHIKLKEWCMQQNGSKYFAHKHTHNPRGGDNRSKQFFFCCSHVAYQIKGN